MSDTFSPLKIPVFRRVWGGSILTYLGMLIQGVGVAWVMVETATSDAMVAWVQAATWAPLMILSIPAGAVSDVFDRRKVALSGLVIALLSACALLTVSYFNLVTPMWLLGLCALTGVGMAFYDPAWQSSVPSLVPTDKMPQAIALRSISQNMARAVGPAIGGVLVAWQGGAAAFLCASLCFVPLIYVIYKWDYQHPIPRLPPERIDEAVITGLRYIKNSPSTRTVVIRGFVMGALGIGMLALMPLAARYRLDGTAFQYGIMLGAFGFGAVAGAGCISSFRKRFTSEQLIAISMLAIAFGAFAMALLPNLWFICVPLVFSGMGWLIIFSTLNISVQTSAPRWVMGRALATYAAGAAGGMALGSFVWGELVELFQVSNTLLVLGVICLATSFIGRWLPIPGPVVLSTAASEYQDGINLALNITHRSGPITVEKEYSIQPEYARPFYRLMQKVERQRKRNGGYGWSLSRDITDESRWIERYHLSTWLDYLRINDRSTDRDVRTLEEVSALQVPGSSVRTRYRLERPMGSVRWDDEVVDPGINLHGQHHH